MPNPKPPYPAQFREQMVELVHAGKKPAELAKEFGCHATSILSWVRLADEASGVVPPQSGALSAAERQELIELRRKLRQVRTSCKASPVFWNHHETVHWQTTA